MTTPTPDPAEIVRGLSEALRKVTPYDDEACAFCGGVGESFVHSPDCHNDNCALAGGIDDCDGRVEECHCRGEFIVACRHLLSAGSAS